MLLFHEPTHLGLTEPAMPAGRSNAADPTSLAPAGHCLGVDTEQLGDLRWRQQGVIVRGCRLRANGLGHGAPFVVTFTSFTGLSTFHPRSGTESPKRWSIASPPLRALNLEVA